MAAVLVVAEEGMGRRIAWVLSEEGFAVRTALSAQDALKEAAAARPDAILLNSVVPPEQIPAFVEELRLAAPRAAIVDIMQPVGAPSMPVATDASLRQPFHADDLVRELRNLIEGSAAPRPSSRSHSGRRRAMADRSTPRTSR